MKAARAPVARKALSNRELPLSMDWGAYLPDTGAGS